MTGAVLLLALAVAAVCGGALAAVWPVIDDTVIRPYRLRKKETR